ncbi:oligosaccharide repeat unit polymerase [Janthinobacterium lividum]|uniref:Oligosaccharide repeat unit polymerase n=2 Tax=Janthinobacterium lividum TaxID=29581 RepID=A0AB38CI55_9BURK|nr:oligosaccharide repeat unit polymerase [Janthinobacterium lividum]
MLNLLKSRMTLGLLTLIWGSAALVAYIYGENYLVLISLGILAGLLLLPWIADYLSPQMAFSMPWIVILLFSGFSISEIHRPIGFLAHAAIFSSLVVYLLVTDIVGAVEPIKIKKIQFDQEFSSVKSGTILFVLLGIAAFNVIYSGYIPLVNILMGASADYLSFGVKSIYGFFNAFANMVGLTFFYLYLTSKKRRYLFFYVAVIIIFLFLVSRQNILSLLVESFVVYSLLRARVKMRKIILMFTILMVCFGALGSLRSGDIKILAKVTPQYMWLPDSVVWGYSYSFFNVLNLDNLTNDPAVPYHDAQSLDPLMPSFLRTKREEDRSFLEDDKFTVSSFIFPIYKDGGLPFTLLLVAIVALVNGLVYRRCISNPSMRNILIYAVLYFCALLSFFTNFWFYLPVIAQLPMILALTWGQNKSQEEADAGAVPVDRVII